MRRSTFKSFLFLILITIIIIVIIYAVGLFNLKKEATQSAKNIKNYFRRAISEITNLDLKNAKKSFQNIYSNINDLQNKTENVPALNSLIKELPTAFNNLSRLSLVSVQLTADLEDLKNNGFKWLVSQKGEDLINQLKKIQTETEQLSPMIKTLQQEATLINYPLAKDFNSFEQKLYQGQQILKTLIAWLSTPESQHFLILFQNDTEIRPGGGFLGSYADATIKRGSLINLEVKDIYDVDGQLKKKIVPPIPLQSITSSWGARDANWFFNFPTSARKVSELLEVSKFYQERRTHFSAVLAINTKIVLDLLDIIGPIELPNYNLIVDTENFLPTIQKEIEVGVNNKAGHPKKILQELTPILFEKLDELTDDQKKELVKKIRQRFINKDILVYFEDLAVESYLKDLGVAGEIMSLPENFNGDYLAVVNANVGGGKSDALIKQDLNLESDIDLSGKIKNKLIVTRSYQKSENNDPWYQTANQDFIQIMTRVNSSLISINGSSKKNTSRDYKKLKYEIDNDLEAAQLETAFDRKTFSTWLNVKPGETGKMTVTYNNDGDERVDFKKPFTFIYEKQSGVDSGFNYLIVAPVGYKWKESGSPVFKYSTENTPARVILELHLIK